MDKCHFLLQLKHRARNPAYVSTGMFHPKHYLETLDFAEMRRGKDWFFKVERRYERLYRLYKRMVEDVEPYLELRSPLEREVAHRAIARLAGRIRRLDDMIVASKELEAEEEPEIVGRITRSRVKEMAKEAHSLITEGSLNLPMIQVFNIFTMKTSLDNDN